MYFKGGGGALWSIIWTRIADGVVRGTFVIIAYGHRGIALTLWMRV